MDFPPYLGCTPLSAALPAAAGIGLAAWMMRNSARRGNGRPGAGHTHAESPGKRHPPIAGTPFSRRPDPDGYHITAMSNRPTSPQLPHARDSSLIAGWPSTSIWRTALAISSIIAATDAILGHHVILIWLLIAGPCCGLLTGRPARTAAAGAWAVTLAVLLGLPDGIWGTWTHLAFLGPVLLVTLVSTVSATLIERHRLHSHR